MKRAFLSCVLVWLAVAVSAQFSINGHHPSCYGLCNGSAQVHTPAGTYHFLWSTADTTASIQNLCAGNYSCIVKDSLGSSVDTLLLNLQQPQLLTFNDTVLSNVTCHGDTTGLVKFNVSGGTGARLGFSWSTGYQGYLSNGDQFNAPAGNYTVTITDAAHCTASTTFTIIEPAAMVITGQVTNTTACNTCNGAISIVASGGSSASYNYVWAGGATATSLTGLCAGGYNVTVTDTAGCKATANFNVLPVQNPLSVSFNTVTNIDCSHPSGFLYAAPQGGSAPYRYAWNTGSTAPDIFNLSAGIYSVSVSDTAGCLAVATDTIVNNGVWINTLLQQDFRCDNNTGKIVIAPAGGTAPYIIHWSNAATADSIDGLRAGNYAVTVTDQTGCRDTQSYTIAQINNAVTVQIAATNNGCANLNNGTAIANVTGGVAPYSYLWNSTPFQTTDTATTLAGGAYRVRVIDAYGCSVFASVNITDTFNVVTVTNAVPNCDSTGTATASLNIGSPPYQYAWSTVPVQTAVTATNLQPGNYQVSVTDSVGCVKTGSTTLQYNCVGYVTGTVYHDNNGNCQPDNGEQGISGVPVYVTNNTISFEGLTDINGQYNIAVNQMGYYQVLMGVGVSSAILQYGGGGCGYMESCGGPALVNFSTTLNNTFQHINFAYVGSEDYDLAINAGWTPVDTSHTKEYWVLYANQAFITPYNGTATITMQYDPQLVFQSGIPAPTNNTNTHTLTWVVDSLPTPTFDWAKRVRAFFTVPASLGSDYLLQNQFHIMPDSADCDTVNNAVYTSQIAGTPAQALFKQVMPAGDIEPGDSVVTYTIHFQNTAADTAYQFQVTDSLSPYLEPSSVQTIASNPLYSQFYMAPGAVLNWVFNPANLPPAAVNPVASAGFVSFTAHLKPGNLSGYYVKNRAAVIVGNGAPHYTNTTVNYIAFPLAINEVGTNPVTVKIFPNPFTEQAVVEVKGLNTAYDLELLDITGRVVQTHTNINAERFELSGAGLSPGVYLYRVVSKDNMLAAGRLVVE